jgi:hypothetical protein
MSFSRWWLWWSGQWRGRWCQSVSSSSILEEA